jgi:EmrB/QacA subfamily drug resistance transporter
VFTAPTPAAPTRDHRAVLAVSCLALATVVAAVASLNVALPSIARETHGSQTQLSWVIDAYALVFAALLLPGGALGDRYGRRRALLAGLAIFGAGSVAAMTAADINLLIGMRTLLGVGAALVMPATLSTITSTFPAGQKARAIGVWAGVAGASAVLGLLASGLLLEWWSWRAVFGLNVVLAFAAVVGVARVVPETSDPDAPRLDVGGALLTVVGLGVLVYSIIEAPTAGWTSARTIIGLAAGVAVLGVFVGWECRQHAPLLDPRLFRDRAFSAGTLSITVQFLAFFGFIFLVLQYLQLVRGDSPLVAAVSLLPMAAAMMPCARLAPRVAARVGARKVCVTGLALITTGLLVLSQSGAATTYWLLLCGLLALGAGMGLAMTPATAAITDALPRAKQGVGSAMNDLARELGGALGIAVLGSVLQATYRAHLTPSDLANLPRPLAGEARSSLALAAHLGVARQARQAFTDGMSSALIVAAVAVAVAAVAVAVLLARIPGPKSAGEQASRDEVAAQLRG